MTTSCATTCCRAGGATSRDAVAPRGCGCQGGGVACCCSYSYTTFDLAIAFEKKYTQFTSKRKTVSGWKGTWMRFVIRKLKGMCQFSTRVSCWLYVHNIHDDSNRAREIHSSCLWWKKIQRAPPGSARLYAHKRKYYWHAAYLSLCQGQQVRQGSPGSSREETQSWNAYSYLIILMLLYDK